MGYEEDIAFEEGNIKRLHEEGRRLIIPRRSISWQFKNISGARNITKNVLITRRNRRAISTRIDASRLRIASLREALLKQSEEPQI